MNCPKSSAWLKCTDLSEFLKPQVAKLKSDFGAECPELHRTKL